MIMTGLKASDKLPALTLCITAHAGACQEQAEVSACFLRSYTGFIPVTVLRT